MFAQLRYGALSSFSVLILFRHSQYNFHFCTCAHQRIVTLLKDLLRKILQFFHLDLTKNLEYDRLTKEILRKHLSANSNAIDIGCHKGEILELILGFAPVGKHYAFEPLPHLYEELQRKFGKRVNIHPFALSDQNGITQFQFVKNAPAFSGIRKRKYLIDQPDIEEIEVQMKTLDDVIDSSHPVDLIKIDVEGGELNVLKGGLQTIRSNQPLVIFEFGKGAAEFYEAGPGEIYDLLVKESGLKISTLRSYVKRGEPLSEVEFEKSYKRNSDYYFVAHP